MFRMGSQGASYNKISLEETKTPHELLVVGLHVKLRAKLAQYHQVMKLFVPSLFHKLFCIHLEPPLSALGWAKF